MMVPEKPTGTLLVPAEGKTLVKITDLNFDGYRDIGIVAHWGSAGTWYSYWLYDPDSNIFVYNRTFSRMPNLKVRHRKDDQPPDIRSCRHAGFRRYTCHTYRFIDGDLREIRKVTSRPNDESKRIRKIWLRASEGSLEEVCRIVGSGPDRKFTKGSRKECF